MRLPRVLLLRTIASVVSMLQMSLCEVPTLRRMDPAMKSGLRTTLMALPLSRLAGESSYMRR
jgi:hypothetical protein